jgi:hypothetical protein
MNGPRAPHIRAVARLVAIVAAWALASVGATAASLSACRQEPDPEAFDGAKLGYCAGYTAVPIPAAACAGCSGQAYALCNGDSFNECACDLPSIYSLDGGTFEAAVTLVDAGGLTALDEDAARLLPCCTGNTVFEIPASECPAHCAGKVGYAVCTDSVYSECACTIPAGFTLSTITCDGG